MVKLGMNIASLRAQRLLSQANSDLSTIFERLSSGQRINRASDDAAGLAIASDLQVRSRVYSQAIRNVNDGISALSIVDSAFESLTSIITRQQELAQQAANGSLSFEQRSLLNAEAETLTEEYNRIVESTSFNGINLLSNPGESFSIQAGYGSDGVIGITLGSELARTIGDGTFQETGTVAVTGTLREPVAADIDNDGDLDLLVNESSSSGYLNVLLNDGNGSFSASESYSTLQTATSLVAADFNNDGNVDFASRSTFNSAFSVRLGNGDGTLQPNTNYSVSGSGDDIRTGDFNNDGIIDLATVSNTDSSVSLALGIGDGTFSSATSFGVNGTTPNHLAVGDINNDGNDDIVVSNREAAGSVEVYLGDGGGQFTLAQTVLGGTNPTEVELSDISQDGVLDLIFANANNSSVSVVFGVGDGTFTNTQTYITGTGLMESVSIGDINGDGLNDLVSSTSNTGTLLYFENLGDGTFSEQQSVASTGSTWTRSILGDFNGDGALDIAAGDQGNGVLRIYEANTTQTNRQATFSIFTPEDARESLTTLEGELERISRERGVIGALESRLNVASNTLESTREAYLTAESRIMAADIAEESANLVRTTILQQAGAAILAQANQQPALAIQLLSG